MQVGAAIVLFFLMFGGVCPPLSRVLLYCTAGAALPAIIKDRADTPRVKVWHPNYVKSSLQQTDMLQAWIGIANMFSAGVFLGGGMIHLLPEANEKMNDAVDTSYPIAFVLSIVGFTFILMVEELVVWYLSGTRRTL